MDRQVKEQWLLPAAIASLGVTVSVFVSILVWSLTTKQEFHLIKQTSAAKSELIQHQFLIMMPNILGALERMRNRWVARGGTPFEDWRLDAANYVKDNEGLKAVEWVDNDYIVRWVEPLQGNEQAMNLDLSFEPKRKEALDSAKQQRRFTLTKPIDLVQGGKGFLSYFPIYIEQRFSGFILGVFDINLLVSYLLPEHFTQEFNIAIYSEGERVFENSDEHLVFNPKVGAQSDFTYLGVSWRILVWPKHLRIVKDGSYVPLLVLITGLCISFLMGLALFFGLYSKLTGLRLIKREIEHKATLDNTIDGIITIDEDGQILTVNRSVERIFGYRQDELVGNNVCCLMPAPYKDEHDQYLQNYKRTKDAKVIGKGRKVEGQHKSGRIFPIDLGVAAYTIADKDYYCGVIRDISAQVAMEQERESLIEKLTKSNTELDNFAYIASHDLKEPLRAIKNHSSFLLEDYQDQLDQDGQHKLHRLIYLSGRMEKLISDLLYYSRLGREEPSFKLVNVTELVADVLERLAEPLIEKKVKVTVNKLPELVCDPTRLMELFYNLITNAYKYNSAEQKRIEIGAEQQGEVWQFYIKDNGIGIDSRFDQDVFKIFKRLNSPKTFGEGSGAGLTFAKKIVEQHQGKIWFESPQEGGTCFYFTLRITGEVQGENGQ